MNSLEFYRIQTVRDLAEKIGMQGDVAVRQFVKSGYQKTFLNQLANVALKLGKLSTSEPSIQPNKDINL